MDGSVPCVGSEPPHLVPRLCLGMYCTAGSAGIRQAPFTELLCVQGSESWPISLQGGGEIRVARAKLHQAEGYDSIHCFRTLLVRVPSSLTLQALINVVDS
jgi:hypothetical protein